VRLHWKAAGWQSNPRFPRLRLGSNSQVPPSTTLTVARPESPASPAIEPSRPAQVRSFGWRKRGTAREHRADIQGLRAVAVLSVALSHASVPGFSGGYVGVDVFFVISGFLITGWLLRHGEEAGRVPLGRFYAARARRILPAAGLTLVAVVVACRYLLNFLEARMALHDSFWAAFFAANIHFASVGTNYFDSNGPLSPLQHFWSLAVEEQFYLVWPLVVLAAVALTSRRGKRPTGLLTVILLLGVTASLAYGTHLVARDPHAAYFSTLGRAWELGIGALLALALPLLGKVPAWLRGALGWIGLAGICVAVVMFTAATPVPGLPTLLPVLSAAAVLAAGSGQPVTFGVGALLGQQPLRFIGDVSYSFYLWHWPFLEIAAERAGHPLSILTNVVLLAAAFAVSVVTYLLYERPIHLDIGFFKRSWAALTLWPISVGAVCMSAILGLASIQAELGKPANWVSLDMATGHGIVGRTSPVQAGSYVAAVKFAVSPSELQHPVTPYVLHQISGRMPKPYENCVSILGTPDWPMCHLGAPHSPVTVVLYGDSHAQQWLPALVPVAAKENWDLVPFLGQGCAAVLWSLSPDAGPDAVVGGTSLRPFRVAECKAWHTWVMAQIPRLHPAAIIYGTAYGWGASSVASQLDDDMGGLHYELHTLARMTKHLVFLEDTPFWSARDPIQCMATSNATFGSCNLALPGDMAVVTARAAAEASGAGAAFIPTMQWFCISAHCPSIIANDVVYRDQTHMTVAYAAYLAPVLYVEMDRVLGPKALAARSPQSGGP
jgi:peptidoglycan/LPS O-acetylase OafA/YrhL